MFSVTVLPFQRLMHQFVQPVLLTLVAICVVTFGISQFHNGGQLFRSLWTFTVTASDAADTNKSEAFTPLTELRPQILHLTSSNSLCDDQSKHASTHFSENLPSQRKSVPTDAFDHFFLNEKVLRSFCGIF